MRLFLLIFIITLPISRLVACSMDNSYYQLKLSDFVNESDYVFVGEVIKVTKLDKERLGNLKVEFRVVENIKGETNKVMNIHINDFTTCEFDYFLREVKTGEIYSILSKKKGRDKFIIVGDNRFNKKFNSKIEALKFLKGLK